MGHAWNVKLLSADYRRVLIMSYSYLIAISNKMPMYVLVALLENYICMYFLIRYVGLTNLLVVLMREESF